MRLTLASVGKLKDGAERELFQRYWERLGQSGRGVGITATRLVEVPEGKAGTAPVRREDEARRLLAAIGEADVVIALDERGKAMTSPAFAALIRGHCDGGATHAAFLIGGPDGHGEQALTGARTKLSLGPMTLPHGLARIVLAEQLYRAVTIIAGHPYHRA